LPKGVPKGKRLIRIPEDLVVKLTEAANLEGRPFYDYTVEALEQALRAHEMKRSVKEIVDFFEIMEIQRLARLMITPTEALNYLIARHYREDRETLQQKWYEAGNWYGNYLQARIRDRDPLEAFGRLLAADRRWNLDDAEVSKTDGTVRLRCVSFMLPLENTELFMRFLEGVMHGLGYETKRRECLKGAITLEFEKHEEGEE